MTTPAVICVPWTHMPCLPWTNALSPLDPCPVSPGPMPCLPWTHALPLRPLPLGNVWTCTCTPHPCACSQALLLALRLSSKPEAVAQRLQYLRGNKLTAADRAAQEVRAPHPIPQQRRGVRAHVAWRGAAQEVGAWWKYSRARAWGRLVGRDPCPKGRAVLGSHCRCAVHEA